MEISIENAGPYLSVRLYGKLDGKGTGAIYDTIVGLGSFGPNKVIVSVGAVTRATRAGCRALIVAAKLLHGRTGKKLLIIDATAEIAAIFDGAGFDHIIDVEERVEVGVSFAA